jgi:hypothetical protein
MIQRRLTGARPQGARWGGSLQLEFSVTDFDLGVASSWVTSR